jgi:hypothetical protein
MKFMLLCYDNEQKWAELGGTDAMDAALRQAIKLTHELNAKGQYLDCSPLRPSTTATCVRIRDGKRLVTDGPFAETREVLGGYYLIDVKDIDEAIEVAKRHPGQRFGGVEVRPVMEIAGLPT